MKNSEKADNPISAMLYLTSPRRLSGKAAQAERTPFKRVSSISMPAWITLQARTKPIPLNGHLESLIPHGWLGGLGGTSGGSGHTRSATLPLRHAITASLNAVSWFSRHSQPEGA